jgi:hypothetical protein
MFRHVVILLVTAVATLTSAVPVNGQDWARKMFKESNHEFGTVIRDAKTEYAFQFENLYMEDVHVAAVSTSCGCTTPRIENATLKTYEKGAIVAHFNTDTFSGQRGATVTVTFDKPFYAEVQLHVGGYIRTDVMLQPGSVQFGSIDQGKAFLQKVNVNYNGGYGNWKIVDVKSNNPNLKAEVVEANRNYGQANYTLKVRLDEKTPAGYINDHVTLVTSDNQKIPVTVEGRIEPSVSVSPAALFMGVVQPGQKVTKQLVVKSKKPFKILSVSCDDKSFEFDTAKEKDDAPKTVHLVPVTFKAGDDLGKVVKTIKIQTDEGQFTPELAAYAVVTK